MSRKIVYKDSRFILVSGIDHMFGQFIQLFDNDLINETTEGEGLVLDWSSKYGFEINLTATPSSKGILQIISDYFTDNLSVDNVHNKPPIEINNVHNEIQEVKPVLKIPIDNNKPSINKKPPIDNIQFIQHDFNLPNHESELCDAEEAISKIKLKLAIIFKENSINDYIHEYYYEETMRILDYIGKLSVPASALSVELEQMYVLKFPHSPALAKKLWLDHYNDIHHPYNLLKNRCFRILKQLDSNYIKVYDKFPPNWKP